MPELESKLIRRLVLALALCGLLGSPAGAQWYFTYDHALQLFNAGNWKAAGERLEQAKREAMRANKQPGRKVLRTSGNYPPFIPDYYLVQVYSKLAAETSDAAEKQRLKIRAAEAFDAATKDQVQKGDPEFARMSAALAVIDPPDPPGPGPGSGSGGPDPSVLVTTRQEIHNVFEQGQSALANQDWTAALAAFTDVQKRLEAVPSLGSEFSATSARIAEASVARDVAAAFRRLRDARDGEFGPQVETLERLNQTAAGVNLSSGQARSLRDLIPSRIAEARLADTLVTAENAMRNRQWSAARDAYESARKQAETVEFTSVRARELSAQAISRLEEARLNMAIDEGRFVDALTIDPNNKRALDGQNRLASTAYNERRWPDAVAAFDTLFRFAANYSQTAVDLKAAAEMQVELGLAAQAPDSSEARRHYDRIQLLKRTIRSPAILDSSVVMQAAAEAASRLNRIDANSYMEQARKYLQVADFDGALNSVNVALQHVPADPDALAFLRQLNALDQASREEIALLKQRGYSALVRGDLDAAIRAAQDLDLKLPVGSSDAAEIRSQVKARRDGERAARQRLNRRYQGVTVGVLLSIGPILLISPRRRGRFLAAIGRPKSALGLYDRILASNPSDGATLMRAAGLARRYGMSAPLDQHFNAYVQLQPADASMAATAADFFWGKGEKTRAAELYEQIMTVTTECLPAAAYDRLAELYRTDGRRPDLAVFERAKQRDPANPGLIGLLTERYVESHRLDAEALAVYRTACEMKPKDATLRLNYARALLANGDTAGASEMAQIAAAQRPDDEAALDLVVEACARSGEAGVAAALPAIERLGLPAISLLVVNEGLAQAVPAIRPLLAGTYRRQQSATDDPVARRLLLAHGHIDQGNLEGAALSLDESCAESPSAHLELRALIGAYRRYFAACAAHGRVVVPALFARVAQLQAAGRWWLDAIVSWQRVVSVPEWNRHAMTSTQDILDSLSLRHIVEVFFENAGWRVRPGRQDTGAFTECLVIPGGSVNAGLAALFDGTQVFSFNAVITVDDIVGLKRHVLSSDREAKKAVAFVIASHAIRHDVYALIYAFMTEEPAVTLIPIEAQFIKEAVVEARTQVFLERLLHQWLGHTDIYETHNPVSNAATFFGRGHFINQLALKISRGENFGIFGLRKIGKTSLVYRLRELSRDHLVAYVDLQGVASRRSDDVYVQLLESLARDMRVKHPDVPVPALRLAQNGRGTANIPSAFHADILAIRTAFETSGRPLPHVLLLIDEIELMIAQKGSPGFEGHQGFFRHIRGLYQQERFVVSAVVGATPTVCRTAAWDGEDNPVFQFYDEVFLAPLDEPECDQMVKGLGELMGVRYDPPSLRLVYEQTAGHPFIARQLCSRLVKSFPERPLEVRTDMVKTAIDEYLAQRGDYFAGLLDGYLSTAARRIVETVAKSNGDGESRGTLLSLTDRLNISRHAADQALGDLELVGLMRRTADRYELTVPLFRRWLRRSWLGVE